tara:strand:- start:18510 stop:20888 length:2379 start_codon:yes stop_codon:yes gene_type:complete
MVETTYTQTAGMDGVTSVDNVGESTPIEGIEYTQAAGMSGAAVSENVTALAQQAVVSAAAAAADAVQTGLDAQATSADQASTAQDVIDSAASASAAAASASGSVLKANNLSDLANAGTSRANLGVAIGVDVQAFSSVLANATASFLTAEKTKLSGIEAGANVTDTANVTAAGALMDSEVDADIKTLSLPASTTISAFGASLIDDAAATNARTTLGLGTADSPQFTGITVGTVAINGGAIDGTVIGATTPAASSFTAAKVADGTLALPSIAFTIDPDTGFYRAANGRFDAVNNGVSTVIFGTASTTVANLTATTADINSGNIDGTTIGATVPAAAEFTKVVIGSNDLATETDLLLAANSVIGSALSINSVTQSGGYFRWWGGVTGAGTGTGGGTTLLTLNETSLAPTIPVRAAIGSNSAPSYSFAADADTGMYRVGVNTIAFSAGGAAVTRIDANGLDSVIGGTTPKASAFTTVYASSTVGIGTATPGAALDVVGGVRNRLRTTGVLPTLNISDLADGATPNCEMFVQSNSATLARGAAGVFFQRNVSTAEGNVNPHALKVQFNTTGTADPASKPWAISAEMTSGATSSTSGEAGTSLSGLTRKTASNNGVIFGGHLQCKDETDAATLGGMIGLELNIQGNGADSNANRYGMDIIARTFSGGTSGNGRYSAAIRIRNDASTSGSWDTGIVIGGFGEVEKTATAIKTQNSLNTSTGHGIIDEGSKLYGVRANGNYGGGAFAMASNQYFEFANVGGSLRIRMKYNSTLDRIEFYKAATLKGFIDMGAGGTGSKMN